jgi:hypothetical protein
MIFISKTNTKMLQISGRLQSNMHPTGHGFITTWEDIIL